MRAGILGLMRGQNLQMRGLNRDIFTGVNLCVGLVFRGKYVQFPTPKYANNPNFVNGQRIGSLSHKLMR